MSDRIDTIRSLRIVVIKHVNSITDHIKLAFNRSVIKANLLIEGVINSAIEQKSIP